MARAAKATKTTKSAATGRQAGRSPMAAAKTPVEINRPPLLASEHLLPCRSLRNATRMTFVPRWRSLRAPLPHFVRRTARLSVLQRRPRLGLLNWKIRSRSSNRVWRHSLRPPNSRQSRPSPVAARGRAVTSIRVMRCRPGSRCKSRLLWTRRPRRRGPTWRSIWQRNSLPSPGGAAGLDRTILRVRRYTQLFIVSFSNRCFPTKAAAFW